MVSNKVYFGMAVGMFGLFFGNSKYKGWLFLFLAFFLAILVFVDLEELLKHTLFYGRQTVSMASTSGRDKIWAIAWEAFLQKPFLGYGFVDGENAVLYSKFTSAINTHSFLFSGLLGTGLAGTVFLLFYFWSAFKKASSKYFPISKFRPAMVSTVIMCSIVSLTAPSVGARVFGAWIPVVLVFSLISALQHQFKIDRKLRIINKILNNENHMDHKVFS
jgi:O-antigen ligase